MSGKQPKQQSATSNQANTIQGVMNGKTMVIVPPQYGFVKLVFHDGKLKSTEESEQTRYN